ncbi:uncharacterized protein [Solanum lycopersicum]|uniref:uncharacterized protein n=1 Tax=Solanum lycopersicum TaxID=4081 RepID=UPI00374927D5
MRKSYSWKGTIAKYRNVQRFLDLEEAMLLILLLIWKFGTWFLILLFWTSCICKYLHCYVAEEPSQWVAMLPWAEFLFNTLFQTSAGNKTCCQIVWRSTDEAA